jgi:hypothetical protein
MADPNLNTPVIIQATRLDSSVLPRNVFSQSYILYVIANGTDVGNVANKANEAGQGAYDAQIRNDEQDVELADHESRITANTNAISILEVRLTTAEGQIIVLRSDVDYLLDEVIDIQADIVAIQDDYVSKGASTNQSIQSSGGSLLVGNIPTPTTDKLQVLGSENVSVSYKVSGNQVVGARSTGWTASTGTASKAGINGSTTYTVGTTYSQSQVQAIATGLQEVRQLAVALQTALGATSGHGLINA